MLEMDQDKEGRIILDMLEIEGFVEPTEGMYDATRDMIRQTIVVEGEQ